LLEKIDTSLRKPRKTLGRIEVFHVFLRVTLPLSMPGPLSARSDRGSPTMAINVHARADGAARAASLEKKKKKKKKNFLPI